MSKQDDRDRGMLEELLELEDGLDDWEVEFIESLSKWRGSFTDRQREKLAEVYERRIG